MADSGKAALVLLDVHVYCWPSVSLDCISEEGAILQFPLAIINGNPQDQIL